MNLKLTAPQVVILLAVHNGTFRYVGRKHSRSWVALEAYGFVEWSDHGGALITKAGREFLLENAKRHAK